MILLVFFPLGVAVLAVALRAVREPGDPPRLSSELLLAALATGAALVMAYGGCRVAELASIALASLR